MDEILARLYRSSRAHAEGTRANLQVIAELYGLKHAMYEGGPDTAGPLQWNRDTQLLLTVIDAHRDPRMRDLILYDLWNNWYGHPQVEGDVFIYFTLQSAYSRWGMWGLTEDITNLQTPKFGAIRDLVGVALSVPPAPLGLTATVVEGGVHLQWEACFGAESYAIKRGEQDGGPYTTIASEIESSVFLDTEVFQGTAYYVVTAMNEQGESPDSVQVQVAP